MPKKFETLGNALQHAYPDISWELDKFSDKSKKSEQRWLKMKIAELLPGVDIVEEYQHPDLTWGKFSNPSLCLHRGAPGDHLVELDVWIPKYRIGIEFQGVLMATIMVFLFSRQTTLF